MKISVPQATLGSVGAQVVDVGQVKLGPLRVGLLTVDGLHVQASTGVAEMRGVRVVLTLAFGLDWTIGVQIDTGLFGTIDFTKSGELDLGTLDLGIGFGNVALPGLADLEIDIPRLPVSDLSAVIGTLKDLKLGPLLAERIKAQGLVAPTQGFKLDGLAVGAASARDVALADAAIDGLAIHHVTGGTLPLAGLTIPGLAIPSFQVPRVSCQKIAADSNAAVTKMPEADVGLLKATLTVTTTAHLEIAELRLDGIRAAASIGAIALKDVELPWEILDLSLSQIGIERIGVPAVKVS